MFAVAGARGFDSRGPPHKQMKRVLSALLALLLVTQPFVGVAAADPVSIFNDGEEEEDGFLSFDIINAASTQVERGLYSIDQAEESVPVVEPEANDEASDIANDAELFLEDNSAEIVSYANQQVPSYVNKSNYNTFKVVINKDDSTATRYVHAPVVDNSYDSLNVSSSTNKTVDYTVTLEGFAADNLNDELDWFKTNYVDEGRDVDKSLKGEWGRTFQKDVTIESGDGE